MQATTVKRDVYKDGLFMIRLGIVKLDGTYLSPTEVTSITAEVLQDVVYTNNFTPMRDGGGGVINNNITIPTTAVLATPLESTTDDGNVGYYNFEATLGPNIFPERGRRNLIVIRFNLSDGNYFFAPRFICNVL